jgi:hypothetical protein
MYTIISMCKNIYTCYIDREPDVFMSIYDICIRLYVYVQTYIHDIYHLHLHDIIFQWPMIIYICICIYTYVYVCIRI